MAKMKWFGVVLVLVTSNLAAASVYKCTIKEYESEESSKTQDLVQPFTVEQNQAGDPIPAKFQQAGQLSWSVTRYDGLISAEVRDSSGQSVSISTTTDGEPLGVKVISEKQILTCNPPVSEFNGSLKVNPMSYGESVSINPNPQSYGSYMQFHEEYQYKYKKSDGVVDPDASNNQLINWLKRPKKLSN